MVVAFNPLAERELNDASQYYELESPGLGAAFLTEVQRCLDAIVQHPQAGQTHSLNDRLAGFARSAAER